jgi:probable rRNA maturation factor
MAMDITIANNQRQVAIALPRFKKNVSRLADCLLWNLMATPPAHLTKKQLASLEKRGSLSVALVTNQKIRGLNKQWRQKDQATDVLSFSFVIEDELAFDIKLPAEGSEIEIGEVIISAQRASSQAIAYGHSLERELAFLFVHGLLHVLGFDHMTKREEKEMFSRQEEILARAGFPRDCR